MVDCLDVLLCFVSAGSDKMKKHVLAYKNLLSRNRARACLTDTVHLSGCPTARPTVVLRVGTTFGPFMIVGPFHVFFLSTKNRWRFNNWYEGWWAGSDSDDSANDLWPCMWPSSVFVGSIRLEVHCIYLKHFFAWILISPSPGGRLFPQSPRRRITQITILFRTDLMFYNQQ